MKKIFKIVEKLFPTFIAENYASLSEISCIYVLVCNDKTYEVEKMDFDPHLFQTKGKIVWNYSKEVFGIGDAMRRNREQRRNVYDAYQALGSLIVMGTNVPVVGHNRNAIAQTMNGKSIAIAGFNSEGFSKEFIKQLREKLHEKEKLPNKSNHEKQ